MNLFEPKFPTEKLHPHFKTIIDSGDIGKMDVLQDWAKGFKDRDGKFVNEFQTTFNSSFWELYLFAVLKTYRKNKGEIFNISMAHQYPDFYLPNLDLAIEATVSLNAEGDDKEDYLDFELNGLKHFDVFNQKAMLRNANSIINKHKKYKNSYVKAQHMNTAAFIIALQDFSQPNSHFVSTRSIETVLYGYYVNEELSILNKHVNNLEIEQISYLKNKNNADVKMGLFTSDDYSDISAVIFNNCATIGKVSALSNQPDKTLFSTLKYNPHSEHPYIEKGITKSKYQESILDGLIIYHNPHAKKPINLSIFEHPKVAQIYIIDGKKFGFRPNKHLMWRNVFNIKNT